LPQSGTAPRLAARALSAVPAGVGAALGSPAGMPGMIAGAIAGTTIPSLVGRAALSGPGRAYLSNQILTHGRGPALTGVGPAAGALTNIESERKRIRMQASI
jgi:hypothetical protein